MSYQPGRMGLSEGSALIFIASFTPVFLSLWSQFMEIATTAAWMMPAINCAGGFIVMYLLLYVLKTTGGDLYSATEKLLGVVAARLIAVYFAAVYLLEAGLLLRQFAENTLLTALPRLDFELASAWFALIAAAALYLGIEAVARGGYLFLPFALSGLVAVLVFLAPKYNLLYLTPWNGPGLDIVLMAGLRSVGVNNIIFVPFFLAESFQNLRTIRGSVLYGLGLSSFIKMLTLIAFVTIVGPATGREKILPYYELARLVYINRFIQRIESFFILFWVSMGILTIAINIYAGLYLLSRLFNLPAVRPLAVPVTLVVTELAMLPANVMDVLTFHIKLQSSVYDIGGVFIPLILFAAAVVRARRRQPCPSG